MEGRVYRKGLGVHSYCLLEYDLGAEFSQLQATIGLDDSARPESIEQEGYDLGSVVFRVRLDGKPVLEKELTWRDRPVPVNLSVQGGRILSLEVDYGGRPGTFNLARDRADWADCRLLR